MKTIKALLSVLFTVSVLCVFGITGSAADGDYTITITPNSQDKGVHTYEAYQVFAGTIAEENNKTILTNITWGDGVNSVNLLAALQGETNNVFKEGNDNIFKDCTDAKDVAKVIGDKNVANDSEFAKKLATIIAANISNKNSGTWNSNTKQITGLAAGYYFVQDADNSPVSSENSQKPAAKTRYILEVVKNVTVSVKSSVPSVVKKVQDINDSDATPTLTDLQDSADYDLGDTIPYTITATIGSGIDNFSSYSFQFVDEMSKGLTLDQGSWDIKVGNKSIKDSFALSGVSSTTSSGGKIWTWSATDIRSEISDGSKVVLTYNCILNADAVIGSAGNPNVVKLKFDNNPNSSGNGTPAGETPWDKNIVFTYKTVFNKVKEDNTTALTGADFKLEKKVDGTWVDVTSLHTGTGAVNPTKTGDSTGSTFTFTGLDDGVYKLTETTTPNGYNTIDPIEFTITAEHTIEADDPALSSLTGTGGATFTFNLSEGSLSTNIVNKKGSTLPSTGGVGTTVFYVIGGVLVAGAAVVLIAKNKMSKN